MPSGAKKRKAAQKKKLNNNNNNNNSSSTNPQQAVEVVKKEDGLSENKSDNDASQSNVEIDVGSKSKTSSSSDSSDDESRVIDKNIVVVESSPNESVAEKISPIADPVKPLDSLLEEVTQVFDETKDEKKTDLAVVETPVVVEEPTAVMSDDLPTSSAVAESVNENEVEEVTYEKASSASKDYVVSSTPPTNLITEVNGAECTDATGTAEQSNRQAPGASPALTVQKTTTWKSCCGIFELFSGSEK